MHGKFYFKKSLWVLVHDVMLSLQVLASLKFASKPGGLLGAWCPLIVAINQDLLTFVRVCGRENEKKFVFASVVMKPSPVGYCLIKPIKYVPIKFL